MLTVLFTRRWLAALAAATVFAVSCFFLGRWQWHRYEVKHAAGSRISAHYAAPPVPLGTVLPSTSSPMTLSRDWTRVTVTGRYDVAGQLLVRNRPNGSVYGYEVVVPLVPSPSASTRTSTGSTAATPTTTPAATASSPALLVDRGWVGNGVTAAQDPAIPPLPSGVVSVTGWLRLGEPDVHRIPRAGQLSSINLPQASASSGRTLYAAYLIVQSERSTSGAIPARPAPLDPPDTDTGEGINLAYAFQWWLGCFAGFGLVIAGVRREALDTAYARSLAPRPPAGGDGHGAPVLVPSRPKRHRIWDDEDE